MTGTDGEVPSEVQADTDYEALPQQRRQQDEAVAAATAAEAFEGLWDDEAENDSDHEDFDSELPEDNAAMQGPGDTKRLCKLF